MYCFVIKSPQNVSSSAFIILYSLVIVPSKRTRGRSKKTTFQSLDITEAGNTQMNESPTVDTPTSDNVTKVWII